MQINKLISIHTYIYIYSIFAIRIKMRVISKRHTLNVSRNVRMHSNGPYFFSLSNEKKQNDMGLKGFCQDLLLLAWVPPHTIDMFLLLFVWVLRGVECLLMVSAWVLRGTSENPCK